MIFEKPGPKWFDSIDDELDAIWEELILLSNEVKELRDAKDCKA